MSDRAANGQFSKGNRAASARKGKTAPGSTGVVSSGGFIHTGEQDYSLLGRQKWVSYSNAFSFPPVAIALLLRYALQSGTKWSAVENEAGGRDARRGVEIVEEGLLHTRLASQETWSEVCAKAGMYWFNGASLHAFGMGRRGDGMVVFTDIAHRPMDTIQRWLRQRENDETTPFVAAEQLTRNGNTFVLPLAQCFYLVDHMVSDDPNGTGVLRFVVERIRRAGNYEKLEGSELFSSLGGLPIARAPMEEILNEIKNLPETEQQAALDERIAALENAVKNRIKTPEIQQYLTLDSKTYTGVDPNTITGIPKWAIEIVKGELQGLTEIRKVISDLHLDVARMLGVEFAFMGGGDTAGTYGSHESKIGVFAASISSSNDRIASRATMQLCRALVAANGLDPDTACPRLVPEPVTFDSVLATAQALSLINVLSPRDPARQVLRDRLNLPVEPDDLLDELDGQGMAPRVPVAEDTTDPNADPKMIDDKDPEAEQPDPDKTDAPKETP